MLGTRTVLFAAAALLTLSACVNSGHAVPTPAPDGAPAAVVDEKVPELHLNLPGATSCDCPVSAQQVDSTFLDKGYKALLDGEYEAAMEYFQRYQRVASSPAEELEARIAIAYTRMVPGTEFYNSKKARRAVNGISNQNISNVRIKDYIVLMLQSLRNLLELRYKLDKLETSNSILKEDLKKREEALKRLRDLTLGQKASSS